MERGRESERVGERLPVRVRPGVCVRAREREREGVCVCVCVRETVCVRGEE